MATISEIVQGLAQAAANSYDGAHVEAYSADGEVREASLRREEGDPLIDKRVIDGFSVKFSGPMMQINYQSEVQLKEVYANSFETEMEQRIADIASFLKKEYRKITGDSVSLTKEGEAKILVQSTGRHRSWVEAQCLYRIGGMDDVAIVGAASEDRLEAGYRKFLEQGGFLGKRPNNDERKK